MQFLVNSALKYIGYPLASKLVDMLVQGIRELYSEYIINKTEDEMVITQQERDVIVKSISRAQNNEERKHLSTLLSKLGSRY